MPPIDKPIFEFLPDVDYIGPHKDKLGIPVVSRDSPYAGLYLLSGPVKLPGLEDVVPAYSRINYTGQPGMASRLYYKLMFFLPKKSYHVVKVDEHMTVSPAHAGYYAQVEDAKKKLEGEIKSGLASAASAVADQELLEHDMRKYTDILNYFSRKEEHALKAMFIDQVDIHTGEGVSMRSIVSRWPTLITDFQALKDEDLDVDKIAKKLKISKAEAVILKTKNILYQDWKKFFRKSALERYEKLKSLVISRKKSVEEYREWIKPYLARFKMMRLGHERPGVFKSTLTSFADLTGQATFSNDIRIWAWKAFSIPETRKPPIEKQGDFIIDPYDEYIRENFILNKKAGLANIYPWLLEKVSGNLKVDIMVNEIKSAWKKYDWFLNPAYLYYLFMDISINRVGVRLPAGEIEDITFYMKMHVLSQNVMLLKLLEWKCREKELERYIDEILGIKSADEPIEDIVKREYPKLFGIEEKEETNIQKFKKEWKEMAERTGEKVKVAKKKVQVMVPYITKRGFYERDLFDRITKQFVSPSAKELAKYSGFLKDLMGVG